MRGGDIELSEGKRLSGSVGIYSKGILKTVPDLEVFLGSPIVLNPKSPEGLIAIAGWGHKPSAWKARQKAKDWNLPYWALEEGFIRSVSPTDKPMSLIIDTVGIYYDATCPSLIENMLNELRVDEHTLKRAEKILEDIKRLKISKYNDGKEVQEGMFNGRKERILIVDQTYGDMSVILGLADEKSFRNMMEFALDNFPNSEIYIKVHPRVIAGEKKGYLYKGKIPKYIKIIKENYKPLSLLEYFDVVLTVSSQLGFESLFYGKKVYTFGMPFYAGWGLTEDLLKNSRRRRRRTLIEILAIAYILYPTYVYNNQVATIERVIGAISSQNP